MNILRFRRYDILVSLGCIALLSSFAWYANKGPRGYAYREGLDEQIAELAAVNDKFIADKTALEKRVQLLRPEHVDRDMLEELARRDLRMVYPNELIVQAQKRFFLP
jgi:cell division protein FtsB